VTGRGSTAFDAMLFDPSRHEALNAPPWSAQHAQQAIDWIVRETQAAWSAERYWPTHPRDLEPGDDPAAPATSFYYGAAGVVWALRYLRAVGACGPTLADSVDMAELRTRNRAWLQQAGLGAAGAYLMGDLPIDMMAWRDEPSAARADALAELIASNIDDPARELMWGAPGSLLAATHLHAASADARWADLVRRIAAHLRTQLHWSDGLRCHYWQQDLYGRRFTFIDAVHGFVATAQGLIRARHLLEPGEWAFWQRCVTDTVVRSATREGGHVNWRPELIETVLRPTKWMMQYCHGAPGFVICLAQWPTAELDDLLLGAGEAIWAAGPLNKGANLCHGTAGNGYAFLVLYQRTGNPLWLERARAFAMHAIAQAEAEAADVGRLRHSLWTGDQGLAIYLWDCLRAEAAFPSLDVFFAPR